jgi:hypothetical protein
MDVLTQKKFVGLYNDAVFKIFPTQTMNAIFGEEKTTDTEGNNKMTLPSNSSTIEEKNEKKSKFLEFMKTNFTNISGIGGDNNTKLIDVNDNVKKFIERMEVKLFKGKGFITILATLHDIIDKLTSTDYNSVHCLSEKVFMAILLAIQMLHYPTPTIEYQLTFQFSKSLFGKSGLEKSSTICSGNKSISGSDDPVAKNIFGLDTKALTPAQASEMPIPQFQQETLETNLSKDLRNYPHVIPPILPPDTTTASMLESTPEASRTSFTPPLAENLTANPEVLPIASTEQLEQEASKTSLTSPVVENLTPNQESKPVAPTTPVSAVSASNSEKLPEMLGDELFNKFNNKTGPLPQEILDYQQKVLKNFEEGNYEVKNIEKLWDYDFVLTELKNNEELRKEVLKILLITPEGDVFRKLSYLVFNFAAFLCSNNKNCSKIYLLTACLLNFFSTQRGGSKSRRKPARKTRRGRTRKSKSKSKTTSKTHRRRRHSRVRKHKKNTYTRRR